jgi:phosphopentomutase
MKCTGQTGRPFKVRYQEHLRDFKYNKNKSKYAQHLVDNKHAIGRMEDIMEIVHITKKGKMMDTLEGFHIYKETKAGNQINDRMTVKENTIFETVIHQDP